MANLSDLGNVNIQRATSQLTTGIMLRDLFVKQVTMDFWDKLDYFEIQYMSHSIPPCWKCLERRRLLSISCYHIIVPLILIFWDVNEKHFTYAGFDHFSILISFYQLCWIYIFIFVLWDLHGKELIFPHMCLVTMNQQNSGTSGLIGVRQAYGWRIS